MKRIKSFFKILGMLVLCASFTGCGVNGNIDDYAVNTGYGDSDTVKKFFRSIKGQHKGWCNSSV